MLLQRDKNCKINLRPNSWMLLGQMFKCFPPCYSQSLLATDFTPEKSGLKLVCNINMETSSPRTLKMFMNSASGKKCFYT
jgi:hypothetical protein